MESTATKTIPLMTPFVPRGAIEAVTEVLKTRWIGQGPLVDEFEKRFSTRLMGGRPCVAVGSCTDALHLSYEMLGIGPADEVIAPVFTCTATNIPLLYCGAQIKFCDVAPDSLNMDPKGVWDLITDRTRAIVVVHYGGAPVNQTIFDIAREYNLPVIEDCAQAVGPSWAGTRGSFSCFSFQAVKHITTGDGGMLVCPPEFEASARRRRWFGIDRQAKLDGTWANDITEVGYKYQMTDIAAAMGLAGLDGLSAQILKRRMMRLLYMEALRRIDGIRVVDTDPLSACWLCTVFVENREDLRRKLKCEGIESDQVHYRNDRYTIFKDFPGEFPNMDAVEGKYLVLPLHMGMDDDDVRRIGAVIKSGW